MLYDYMSAAIMQVGWSSIVCHKYLHAYTLAHTYILVYIGAIPGGTGEYGPPQI